MLLGRLPLAILASVVLNCAFAFAQQPPYEYKEPDWAFPRAGMQSKVAADGKKVYRLDGDLWAMHGEFKGIRTAVVTLPPNLDTLIDKLNRIEAGGVPNRDQFIVAIVLAKAVVTPDKYLNEYLGSGIVDNTRLHFFKLANGAYVGGGVSPERTFVLLIPAPDPGRLLKSAP